MKKTSLLFVLIFSFFSLSAFSQKVDLSPNPQSVEWGGTAFYNSVSFNIIGEKVADADAVRELKKGIKTDKKGIKLIIGEKGGKAVRSVKNHIPNSADGYYLKVEPRRVIIAGNDATGTFYGVQTFLQLLKSEQVPTVTINDFPDVGDRGIVEGFYGNPYSYDDRVGLFEFMGKNKLNVYMYGPKNDPYHGFGAKWREPYPPKEAQDIKRLIDAAHQNKVNFIWAVHPGNHISWDDTDGDGVVDDFKACVKKFESMYDLGVRSFAVFFDDIGGIGVDGRNQAKMMNYLHENFVAKKSDVTPLVHCPTQYNERRTKGDYLHILRDEMEPSVRVMWTGKSVVRQIDMETMEWINPRIGRNAYIWWNYPVTDYILNRLFLGAVPENSKEIAPMLSGFVSNPMEYAEASKVALFGIADYCWNMKDYNAQTAWENALKYLMPGDETAFRVFCENNQDLGEGEMIRNLNESAEFKAVSEKFLSQYASKPFGSADTKELDNLYQKFRTASLDLLKSKSNPLMLKEIAPWVKVLDLMAQKGQVMNEMYKLLASNDSIGFVAQYEKLTALDKEQSTIRSRNFAGSKGAPNPRPANLVLLPFLKEFRDLLTKEYQSRYNYKSDIFPKPVLEEGHYYIKFNGKYLTNRAGYTSESNPVFVSELDIDMPARQEWLIKFDYATDRYSVVNMFDSRFLDEKIGFTEIPYSPAWHTFRIIKENGKFAVQNGEKTGYKIWKIEGNKIIQSTVSKLTPADYMFEIESVEKK